MTTTVESFVTLFVTPTRRRIFGCTECAKAAEARGLTEIAERATAAVRADEAVLELERARRAPPRAAQHAETALERDARIDHALTAIDQTLAHVARVFGEESERGQKATALRKRVFPLGVTGVTALPYVEQYGEVKSLLTKLEGDWAADVQSSMIAPFVAQLAELNPGYGAILNPAPDPRPTADEVRAANAKGQRRLLALVATILGRFPDDTDTDIAARDALLGPIARQNDALRELRRTRGGGGDPATLDLPDPDAPPAADPTTTPASNAPDEPPTA
ncbi:MAG: hypothetical protein R3F39_23455 [Myxococcota bacterium]